MYFTAEATPLKVGSGSNVTVPLALTVYVPSFATVKVDNEQLAVHFVDGHVSADLAQPAERRDAEGACFEGGRVKYVVGHNSHS
jgi:hypothetical protein